MIRGRTSGIGGVYRPRQPAPTLSQNFKPKSEWRDEGGAAVLLIYLPGFIREQISVKNHEADGVIEVQAERWLPNKKSLRVNETFVVPAECDAGKLETQFVRGILTLKMPKNINLPLPKETSDSAEKENHNQTPKEILPPKAEEEDFMDAKEDVKKPENGNRIDEIPRLIIEERTVGSREEKMEERKQREDEKRKEMEAKAEAERKGKGSCEVKEAGAVVEPNEKRKLLVNMGVAVIIIVMVVASTYKSFF